MTVPDGFKEFYPNDNTLLHIMKPIYKLKQAGLYYWVAWVDDNVVIAPPSIVEAEKDLIKCHFKCNNIGYRA